MHRRQLVLQLTVSWCLVVWRVCVAVPNLRPRTGSGGGQSQLLHHALAPDTDDVTANSRCRPHSGERAREREPDQARERRDAACVWKHGVDLSPHSTLASAGLCLWSAGQRVYRGWRVRRLLLTAVRSEFESLVADVERRAIVQAVRAQQQQQQVSSEHEAGTLSEATRRGKIAPPSYPQPRTLCRPRFQPHAAALPLPLPPPAPSSLILPAADDAKAAEPEPSAEASAAHPSTGSATALAPHDDYKHDSHTTVAPQPAQLDVSEEPSHLAAPTGAWRPLETQILSVQAAIRQRLLVSQLSSHMLGVHSRNCVLTSRLCPVWFAFCVLQLLRQQPLSSAAAPLSSIEQNASVVQQL